VWESTLPTKIPLLTIAQFEELKKLLREAHGSKNWTEGRVRKARATTDAAIPVDPVVEYLRHSDEWKGRVRFLSSERLDIMCPWIHEHTSQTDASSTSYFFAGTGGFECGHFRCLHAHCSDRSTADFLREIGYMADGFEDISGGVSEADVLYALTASVDGSASDTPHPLALPAFDRQPKTGKIKPHVNNLLVFMKWLCETGEGVRFDVFRDEIVLATPQGERPFTDADYTRLQVKAEQGETGFAPLQMDLLRRVVHMVAQNRCFDSAQAWIAALPAWDGVPRVDAFCSTYLGAAPSLYATAVARYLWSAMPGRILRPGTQADMSVILVSAQGTGKSSSIRAIAPMKDYYIDLSLSDRDADLSRLTRGKTLVELAELRGLHTKEMDSIKSFATRLESEWVPKYFEMRTVYLRRFIMMGTTNNDEFLGDATGERRWLPIRVGVQEIDAIKRDHAQLWAEGTHLYRTEGIVWREAQRLAEAEHADFSIQDTWVDDIDEWLHREEFGRRPVDGEFLLMKEVLRDGLRLEKTDKARANQMRAADALRRLGYAPQTKWLNNRPQRVWVKNLTTSYDLQNEVVMDFF
jgi:predicted P-loop ATPase